MFMGIGLFRYSPHLFCIMFCARYCVAHVTDDGMPWLVRQMSVAFYFVSIFILADYCGGIHLWYQDIHLN